MNERRRKFVKAAYVAPVVVTLKVAPAFAKVGSEKPVRKPFNDPKLKGKQ